MTRSPLGWGSPNTFLALPMGALSGDLKYRVYKVVYWTPRQDDPGTIYLCSKA